MQMNALVGATNAVRRVAGGSFVFDRAIFFLAVLRASGGVLGAWAKSPAQGAGGGISINAISHSMNRPFETVRRHVNALIGDGLCVRTGTGVVVAPDLLDRPEMASMLAHLHDCLIWWIVQLRSYDVPLPRGSQGSPYRPDITLAASIDLSLSAFESVGHYYADWLELAVVNAVMAASSRPITFDPTLARLYSEADTIPPAERRRAVSAAAVARALGIPYSTVRRQVIAATDAGMLVERDGGVIVDDAVLAGPGVATAGSAAVTRSATLLGRLVAGGFPFDHPAQAYVVGAPLLLSFG
jgi:DNA-binding Lrp family transcriptional regulator